MRSRAVRCAPNGSVFCWVLIGSVDAALAKWLGPAEYWFDNWSGFLCFGISLNLVLLRSDEWPEVVESVSSRQLGPTWMLAWTVEVAGDWVTMHASGLLEDGLVSLFCGKTVAEGLLARGYGAKSYLVVEK